MTRAQLRSQLRRQRRSLSAQQQRQAARRLKRVLSRQPVFQRARRIGFYLASDGEISAQPLIELALSMGKRCFLPVLHPTRHNRLWFGRYRPESRLVKNCYGIEEPDIRLEPRVSPASLDLVLMPLVGFDPQGGRLGMGGGYYDRTFAFKLNNTVGRRSPVLIGLAHELQKREKLDLADWDIPLEAVASDQRIYWS